MKQTHRQSGFSLTELLLAIATLAIGMLFVGGTFLLGVHYSRLSTEQTIAPVVAEEAFAKIALYGDPNIFASTEYQVIRLLDANEWEYTYPSTRNLSAKQYQWTAIGRKSLDSNLLDVTVFVLRVEGKGFLTPSLSPDDPRTDPNLADNMTVVQHETGRLYQTVLERGYNRITDWLPEDPNGKVWYVEPSKGRNPCVGVFQRKIRF